jgi:hypothetical protein
VRTMDCVRIHPLGEFNDGKRGGKYFHEVRIKMLRPIAGGIEGRAFTGDHLRYIEGKLET